MIESKAVKMMFLIIDEGIRPDVEAILDEHGLSYWTSWSQIVGQGETGAKHGDPIWPGLNDVFLLALEAEKVEPLVTALHALRDGLPIVPGMRIILSDAQFI